MSGCVLREGQRWTGLIKAERLFAVDYFEGPLIPEEKMRMWKKVGAEADVKDEGADVGKVEDEIDGITLRGD